MEVDKNEFQISWLQWNAYDNHNMYASLDRGVFMMGADKFHLDLQLD